MQLPSSVQLSRGSILHTNTGTVIQTDHGKFLLVVGEIGQDVGLVCINTLPRRMRPESQVEVGPTDAECLSHESYLDCGELTIRPKKRLEALMNEGHIQYRCALSAEVFQQVVAAAQKCTTLNAHEKAFFGAQTKQ